MGITVQPFHSPTKSNSRKVFTHLKHFFLLDFERCVWFHVFWSSPAASVTHFRFDSSMKLKMEAGAYERGTFSHMQEKRSTGEVWMYLNNTAWSVGGGGGGKWREQWEGGEEEEEKEEEEREEEDWSAWFHSGVPLRPSSPLRETEWMREEDKDKSDGGETEGDTGGDGREEERREKKATDEDGDEDEWSRSHDESSSNLKLEFWRFSGNQTPFLISFVFWCFSETFCIFILIINTSILSVFYWWWDQSLQIIRIWSAWFWWSVNFYQTDISLFTAAFSSFFHLHLLIWIIFYLTWLYYWYYIYYWILDLF